MFCPSIGQSKEESLFYDLIGRSRNYIQRTYPNYYEMDHGGRDVYYHIMNQKCQNNGLIAILVGFDGYMKPDEVGTIGMFIQNCFNEFSIPDDSKKLLWCCLHFRRIETIHDGWRWMDIKRYGIEIEHTTEENGTDRLTWDDPRRAIQLSQRVIVAGLQPNPRNDASSASVSSAVQLEPEQLLTPIHTDNCTRLTE